MGAVLLTACWWFTRTELHATFWGFPLDDSWIHLQFARNVASGQGFSYNPGIPVAGSTAPLWTLVLAIPARLGLDPVASAKGLGIALTLAAALVAGRLAEWLTSSRAAGFFTALVLAVSPRLIWGALSGMEVSLYSFLGVWAVLSYLRALDTGAPWWGLLVGLAGATRPEVFVLFPILAADWTVRAARRQLASTSAIRWAAPLLLFAIPAGAFVALNLYASGHPLPLTFYAKSYGMGTVPSLMEGRWHDAWVDAWRYPQQFFYLLLTWTETEYPDLGLGALVGAAALTGLFGDRPQRRGAYLLVVILVAAPTIKAFAAPQPPLLVHDGRYLFHLLILFLVVGVAGLMELHTRLKWKVIVPLYCLVSLIRLGGALAYEAPRYASKVKNINDLEVAAGHWIQRETSEDARDRDERHRGNRVLFEALHRRHRGPGDARGDSPETDAAIRALSGEPAARLAGDLPRVVSRDRSQDGPVPRDLSHPRAPGCRGRAAPGHLSNAMDAQRSRAPLRAVMR